MKQYLSFGILVVFAILFGASATQKAIVAPPKQTFTFDYKTPSTIKPGSANITISLVRPRYAEKFAYENMELFTRFRDAMDKDVEELLSDKGFHLRGPYQSYDEMVFEDKKDADIAIQIEIMPELTAGQGGWRAYTPFTLTGKAPTLYFFTGTVSLVGKINLTGFEPLSHEKLWIKSVDIPAITDINISTASKDFESPAFNAAFFADPNVYNALGNALQQQYKGIMTKIDAHFDPREFTSLKSQIKELKSKKGY